MLCAQSRGKSWEIHRWGINLWREICLSTSTSGKGELLHLIKVYWHHMWPHLSLLALLMIAKLQAYKGGGGGGVSAFLNSNHRLLWKIWMQQSHFLTSLIFTSELSCIFLVNISASWLNWQRGISEVLFSELLLTPLEQYVGHSSQCLLTESLH